MPGTRNVSLDVTIMGREFRIACPENEREGLLRAVSFLDKKMREIRDGGKVIGVERIAIMAALNIAHDLILLNRGQGPSREDLDVKLTHLHNGCLIKPWPQDNLF
jgi:cell division protein ZapA